MAAKTVTSPLSTGAWWEVYRRVDSWRRVSRASRVSRAIIARDSVAEGKRRSSGESGQDGINLASEHGVGRVEPATAAGYRVVVVVVAAAVLAARVLERIAPMVSPAAPPRCVSLRSRGRRRRTDRPHYRLRRRCTWVSRSSRSISRNYCRPVPARHPLPLRTRRPMSSASPVPFTRPRKNTNSTTAISPLSARQSFVSTTVRRILGYLTIHLNLSDYKDLFAIR